jgi:hypothetical protein
MPSVNVEATVKRTGTQAGRRKPLPHLCKFPILSHTRAAHAQRGAAKKPSGRDAGTQTSGKIADLARASSSE